MTPQEVASAFAYLKGDKSSHFQIIAGTVPGMLTQLLPDLREYAAFRESIQEISRDFRKYTKKFDSNLREDALATLARRVQAKLNPNA